MMMLLAGVAACGPGRIECNTLPANVTYDNRVKGLLEQHCTSCHASSKSGLARQRAPNGVDYDTYETARTHADDGAEEVQEGEMPPPERRDTLGDEDRCVLRAWVAQGTPR